MSPLPSPFRRIARLTALLALGCPAIEAQAEGADSNPFLDAIGLDAAGQETPDEAQQEPEPIEPADLVVMGRIYTGNPEYPRASLMAVRGDRIVHIGEVGELRETPKPGWIGPKTTLLRRSRGAVLPGFNDAHGHLMLGLGLPFDLDLSGATSILEVAEQVAIYAKRHPDDERILGYGWRPSLALTGREPHREMLDRAVADRPVFLLTEGPHVGWLNSAALEALGILSPRGSLPRGTILRDETKLPSGILLSQDMPRVIRKAALPSERDLLDSLERGLPRVHEVGITSLQEPITDVLAVQLGRAFDNGKLTVRVHVQRDGTGRLDRYEESITRPHWITFESKEDAQARASMWRFLAQGRKSKQVQAHTFGQYLEQAKQRGTRTAFHTPARVNYPLIQGYLFPAKAVVRLRELKPVATVTPAFLAQDLRQPDYYEYRYGKQRGPYALPLRALLDAGVTLAFGSEYGLSGMDPYVGIYAACRRRPPGGHAFIEAWQEEQLITVEEALRAYTLGPAIAQGMADQKGTLEVGKLADFILVEHDPFALGADALPPFEVTHTVVGGQVVYRRPE